jgi:hypothetical protein
VLHYPVLKPSKLQSRNLQRKLSFLQYHLNNIHANVKLSITVKTGNVRVTFMSEDASTGVQTVHVERRYHFAHSLLRMVLTRVNFLFS